MLVYFWLIVAAICFMLEVYTRGLTAIWYCGGALAGALSAKLGFSLGWQIGAFLVISLVLFLPTRKLAARMVNSNLEKTNAESLIGQICIVTKDIDNLKASGQAVVKGMEWTARSVNDEEMIPKGTKVEIMDISGVKLIVKPIEENRR